MDNQNPKSKARQEKKKKQAMGNSLQKVHRQLNIIQLMPALKVNIIIVHPRA